MQKSTRSLVLHDSAVELPCMGLLDRPDTRDRTSQTRVDLLWFHEVTYQGRRFTLQSICTTLHSLTHEETSDWRRRGVPQPTNGTRVSRDPVSYDRIAVNQPSDPDDYDIKLMHNGADLMKANGLQRKKERAVLKK